MHRHTITAVCTAGKRVFNHFAAGINCISSDLI
nr:MAG TPA: hypothetical protein [Caudoviricetes sp.]